MKWFLGFLVVLTLASQAFGATDALSEVNALRAKQGLKPFARHDGLSKTAARCADFRAVRLIEG